MYRMYNITLNDDRVSSECSYVSYNNLDSIPDFSADHISCDIIQKISSSAGNFIKTIFEKVKPGGVVILTVLDLVKVAKDYINSNISGQEFLRKTANLSEEVSLEDIRASVSQIMSVQQVKYENDSIIVALIKRGC